MTIRTAGLLFCLALLVQAQLYTGSVTGIVVDPSGAPVFQADVSLTDVDRNTHSAAKTDGGGRYLLPALPPGNYALEVNAPGFQPYDVTKIAIDVNGTVTANANLLLSGRQIDISVESEASLLSEDATISQTLTRQLINDLPLVNRNTFDLAFLAPGVSQAPGSTYGNGVSTPGFMTNFVSDGSRNAQADLLLDGVSVMNSDNNPGVQKALYVPPVDAIQEFKIQLRITRSAKALAAGPRVAQEGSAGRREGPLSTERTVEPGDFDAKSSAALRAMREKAEHLHVGGAAVIAFFKGSELRSWTSRMVVVDRYKDAPSTGNAGANLLAIAYAKAAEMADTLKDSGHADRPALTGELGWRGGVVNAWNGGYLVAAFSGGKSEDDVEVSKAGILAMTAGN